MRALALKNDKSKRTLSPDFFIEANDSTLNNIIMIVNDFLKSASGNTMATSVNHIINSSHNVNVTMFIFDPSITSCVVARCLCKILVNECLIISPKCKHE